ncbi:unnamed protein product [Urochloa humidicola]
MDADPSRQVRVRFFTKLPPPLRAPPASIAVPADLSRMGLSEIVNSLHAAAEPDHKAQPFDSSTSSWTASSCGCLSSSSSSPRACRRRGCLSSSM